MTDIPTSSVWIDNQNQGICSGYVNSRNLVLFDYAEKQEIKSVFSADVIVVSAVTGIRSFSIII